VSRKDKKDKFSETGKKSRAGTMFLIGILAAAFLGIGAYVLLKKPDVPENAVNVGAVDYAGGYAQFEKVEAQESGGNIVIDLEQLKEKKALTFDVQGISFTLNNGTPFDYLPVLAYITPKGNVVVATSLCEPCSGIDFSVAGDNLHCDACGTLWTLEGLKGVSGGCLPYPPESIEYKAEGGKLLIDRSVLENWQPREV